MDDIDIEVGSVIDRLTTQISQLSKDLAVAQATAEAWSRRALAAEAALSSARHTE